MDLMTKAEAEENGVPVYGGFGMTQFYLGADGSPTGYFGTYGSKGYRKRRTDDSKTPCSQCANFCRVVSGLPIGRFTSPPTSPACSDRYQERGVVFELHDETVRKCPGFERKEEALA